jgi:hypothetical protein
MKECIHDLEVKIAMAWWGGEEGGGDRHFLTSYPTKSNPTEDWDALIVDFVNCKQRDGQR